MPHMPLSVPLLFHFNQHLSEYARIASRVCYCGLLKVLRSHPALKFNIHISGTLIHALKWVAPEPLELIRDGLNDGQFELLGSTYAQNILYSSDDWDNARQIELHQQALSDAFGVEPTAFWNVERCWRQSLAPIIAEAGYRLTLVEDHILRKAGAVEPFVFTTPAEVRALSLITDDETLKHKFNLAAWFGRETQVLDYLRAIATRPGAENKCLAYAEDAEAMGLWGAEAGAIPNQTWARLDHLLTALEAEADVQLVRLSDAPQPSAELTSIPDGSAAWMNASLKRIGAPYHEDGYADWFDFNRRAPKLVHFRQTYSIIRGKLQALESALPAPQRLKQTALHAFCAHQYEFGCVGVGGLNYGGWENARTAVAVARAAKIAESPSEFVVIDDCNGDGSDEVLISDGAQLLITSAYGGRVLYWFDLITGRQFVGNQLPVVPAEYTGDAHYPVTRPYSMLPLPETDSPLAFADHDGSTSLETPPTRLGRFLPEWIWEGEAAPLPLAVRPALAAAPQWPFTAQTRAFSDHVQFDSNADEEPPVEWLDSRLEKNGVAFLRYLNDELTIEKTLRLVHGRAVCTYVLRNLGATECRLRLRVTHELCPDYDEALRGGRGALEFLDDPDAPGVINTRTGAAITAHATRPWQTLERRVDFYALTVGLIYDVTLAPRSEQRFDMKLKRTNRGETR